jgi:phytoene dehydrogenase-like protein
MLQFVQARKAVVSNASTWDTVSLLPPDAVPKELQTRAKDTPQCDSFMHLHLGIDAKDLPSDLEIHHIVVNDWSQGVDAPQNVVLISVPSVLDPSLAPAGKHVLHAYTPGSEPYSLWKDLDRQSAAYRQLKAERSEVCSALSCFSPSYSGSIFHQEASISVFVEHTYLKQVICHHTSEHVIISGNQIAVIKRGGK